MLLMQHEGELSTVQLYSTSAVQNLTGGEGVRMEFCHGIYPSRLSEVNVSPILPIKANILRMSSIKSHNMLYLHRYTYDDTFS